MIIDKEYTYQVKEEACSDENITYDSSVYTVTVKVYTDSDKDSNENAVIIADSVITKDGEEVSEITFNNTTKEEDDDDEDESDDEPTPVVPVEPAGKLSLTARKTLDSGLPDQNYTFCLLDAGGNVLQTKQNDLNGVITFEPIYYSSKDIGQAYAYQVMELAGSDETITYDSSIYTVNVKPYQDPNNATAIIATPVITKDGTEVTEIAFNNVTNPAETIETQEPQEPTEDRGATQREIPHNQHYDLP